MSLVCEKSLYKPLNSGSRSMLGVSLASLLRAMEPTMTVLQSGLAAGKAEIREWIEKHNRNTVQIGGVSARLFPADDLKHAKYYELSIEHAKILIQCLKHKNDTHRTYNIRLQPHYSRTDYFKRTPFLKVTTVDGLLKTITMLHHLFSMGNKWIRQSQITDIVHSIELKSRVVKALVLSPETGPWIMDCCLSNEEEYLVNTVERRASLYSV